jgi:hypothetical protein
MILVEYLLRLPDVKVLLAAAKRLARRLCREVRKGGYAGRNRERR